MIQRTWKSGVAAAGAVLALVVSFQMAPAAEAVELADLLASDGFSEAEIAQFYEKLRPDLFEPPPCVPGSEMFTDVPAGNPFCPWIEELARRGITAGCSLSEYCPGNPVTRQQMAVFIIRGTPVPITDPVFHRIAGSNFTPRDSVATFSYLGGGCMHRDSNVGDSWFTHEVQLPHGAEIDFLRVLFYDNSATYDINSELWAFDGAGGTNLIAEADSSGTPGYSSEGSGFFSHIVDNLNESLVLVASIQGGVGSSLALCGVRIRYQLPENVAAAASQGVTTAQPDQLARDNAESGRAVPAREGAPREPEHVEERR